MIYTFIVFPLTFFLLQLVATTNTRIQDIQETLFEGHAHVRIKLMEMKINFTLQHWQRPQLHTLCGSQQIMER